MNDMEIHGIQKLTLLDYPGHTACTVFTGRCNFRCPFCHNASLVLRPWEQPTVEPEELFALLKKRRGLLDGVCITGGEPTLQRDLSELCEGIKTLGFAVKLDTNGTNPAVLASLMERGLVDYVAMDIKTSREQYGRVCGIPGYDTAPVEESAKLLLSGNVSYEFRTTLVRELHEKADIHAVGAWLRGAKAYFLQGFRDSGDLIASGLSALDSEEMETYANILRLYIENVHTRGVD